MHNYQKDQILAVVAHYMDLDLRGKIMSEVPQAYNAWIGKEIVRVVKNDDKRPAISGAERLLHEQHRDLRRCHPAELDNGQQSFEETGGFVSDDPSNDGHCDIGYCQCDVAETWRDLREVN